jgi:hypothetical protein
MFPASQRRAVRATLSLLVLVVCVASVRCGGGNTSTGPTPPPTPGDQPPGPPNPNPNPVPSSSQIFVGAGDIAMCDQLDPARQTGRLVRDIGGTVFVLGDNAYFGGTAREYRDCYDTTWGGEKFRTRPVLGNHEYEGGNSGGPYFDYFGTNAGSVGQGYYSFPLGTNWHAIALNSNIPASENSPQGQWLKGDLAASRTKCTIAYWHHPLFTSGQNGPQVFMRDIWRLLYAAGADVVLSGHDHLYERFAPQDADGRLDPQRGMREFIVGTGGALLYNFVTLAANSEHRLRAFGVLKLTLETDSYQWQFIQTNGAIGDSGTGQCH